MQNILDIRFWVCYLICQRETKDVICQNGRKGGNAFYEKPETQTGAHGKRYISD